MDTASPAPLPWLAPTVARALAMPHAHALLLHGAAGDGLFECATTLVNAWLCEALDGPRPCGHCGACRLLAGGLHPDLHLLMPEALRHQLGLAGAEAGEGGDGEGGAKGKRKPSRQIRIDDVRAAIDWVATTSSRGRAKVVLVHPAEAMNLQSANALLKTLEEPPRGARLLLTAAEPAQLLPTVRSRCQVVRLAPPDAATARDWLQAQGLAQPEVLLAACSQRPLDALAMAAAGIDAARWAALPAAVLARQSAALTGWTVPHVVETLQKLCHDGLAVACGASPRFFPPQAVPVPARASALAAWGRDLARLARQADHPWNEGLWLDAQLARAAAAWRGEGLGEGDRGSDTLAT
jgi:DNA polymerase-3 subunit delta'